jgi:hypothetical protein
MFNRVAVVVRAIAKFWNLELGTWNLELGTWVAGRSQRRACICILELLRFRHIEIDVT